MVSVSVWFGLNKIIHFRLIVNCTIFFMKIWKYTQYTRPVCMTNMYTVEGIEQRKISHLFQLVTRQGEQFTNTGLPNFSQNHHILSRRPDEIPSKFFFFFPICSFLKCFFFRLFLMNSYFVFSLLRRSWYGWTWSSGGATYAKLVAAAPH